MAGKRLTRSVVDWQAFTSRIPEQERQAFLSFRAKSEGYARRVLQYPEAPPAIDWAFYRTKISIPGFVDQFEKSYKAVQVPYPADTTASELAAAEKKTAIEMEEFRKESKIRVEAFKPELAKLQSMIPFEEMTMEEFADYFPDKAFDQNKPRLIGEDRVYTRDEYIDLREKGTYPSDH